MTIFRRLSNGAACALLAFSVILQGGCGYTWRGQEIDSSENRIIPPGKTLKIQEVDHATIYPWLTYRLRSQFRDEINARGMAKWVDSGMADYALAVHVRSLKISSAGEYRNQTLLFEAEIRAEISLFDASNREIWRSGSIVYTDRYENMDEEESVKNMLTMLVRRCIDRMQQQF
ncbi:MAG: LPS assembly lipoprotein LptE [Desulfovibrionaceae bacterium]|nr:LPS assembly lipoprotein LptE [Desulfovibrionaceae bacterium]